MRSSFLMGILGTGQPLLLAVMGLYRWRMMVDVELMDVIWDSDIQKRIHRCARVRGRNADLTLVKKVLGWKPRISLEKGLETMYKRIKKCYVKNNELKTCSLLKRYSKILVLMLSISSIISLRWVLRLFAKSFMVPLHILCLYRNR